MKILILPDSFKGSLSAGQAAAQIESAARKVFPEAQIESFPIADGGEGTLEMIEKAAGGAFLPIEVMGPCGQRVRSRYLSVGDTAVVELAEAAGLGLRLPGFSPMKTTTIGVGQIIAEALHVGHRRIVIALGGSATTDCGCGMAAALGTQFLDAEGRPFLPTGATLSLVRGIRLNGFFFGKHAPRIEALCDVENPLYGPQGAAYVFGPQKGATPEEVKILDAGLKNIADLFQKRAAKLASLKGSGAAGGTGAGVAGFLNGRLLSGIDALLDLMKFEDAAKTADLIITGEGAVDSQTKGGKVAAGIARRAAGKPVVLFTGANMLDEKGLEELYGLGITSVLPILQKPSTLGEAMSVAGENLHIAALNFFRAQKALTLR